MRDFHKLKVWERAHKLTLWVYEITNSFPKEEIYSLTSQMRRAAASIPTNIAEGCGRDSKAETIQFFIIASGSASELEYQILLAHDLHYIDDRIYDELGNEPGEIRRMIAGYVKRLKADTQ
ncbi:MAG: diversity-generating retroelement protein bAvd family protein [Anaerolineales bacterium]|nr:MAG: diversity-generating retroelement protein bAvd family protein [Anaerolineales bacterium]